MRRERFSMALAAAALLACAPSPSWSVPREPPDFGLRGLQRAQVVFLPVASGEDPAKDAECRSIVPALARAGLEVVEGCRPDDAACGKLFLTMETSRIAGSEDRMYLVQVELSQPLQLVRAPGRGLSSPITWSIHRFGVVDTRHSITAESCRQLQDLMIWFGSQWKVANR